MKRGPFYNYWLRSDRNMSEQGDPQGLDNGQMVSDNINNGTEENIVNPLNNVDENFEMANDQISHVSERDQAIGSGDGGRHIASTAGNVLPSEVSTNLAGLSLGNPVRNIPHSNMTYTNTVYSNNQAPLTYMPRYTQPTHPAPGVSWSDRPNVPSYQQSVPYHYVNAQRPFFDPTASQVSYPYNAYPKPVNVPYYRTSSTKGKYDDYSYPRGREDPPTSCGDNYSTPESNFNRPGYYAAPNSPTYLNDTNRVEELERGYGGYRHQNTVKEPIPQEPIMHSPATPSPLYRMVNIPEVTIPIFSGNIQDYRDFKELFQAVTIDYTPIMQVLHLKPRLDEESRMSVAHIQSTDYNAIGLMWEELDKKFGQNKNKASNHLAQLFKIFGWRKSHSMKDLEQLFNHIRYHYTSLSKCSPEYLQQAEGIKHFLAPALYGNSFIKVTKLMTEGRSFTLKTVLGLIEQHIAFERTVELSEIQSTFPKVSKDYDNKREDYDYRSNYRRSPSRSSSSYNNSSYRSSRSPSYNRGKERSFSPHKGEKSYGRRETSSPRRTDRDDSPHKVSIYTTSTEGDKKVNHEHYTNRSHSKSPNRSPAFRGHRSHSPIVGAIADEYTFKCHICRTDSHNTVNCTVKSSKQMLDMARNWGLCFKCLLKGHMSKVCLAADVCKATKCKSLWPHAPVLCPALSS